MDRLYQLIVRHFSQSEIANLAADLGVYVPSNADPNSMARELFSGAKRNLRLDALFNEIHRRKAALELDLGANLYELIAGTFNETQAAQLSRSLGLDRLGVGLDVNGLIGWNNDDFFKNKKAQTIQDTALKQGKYEALLAEMKNIRPSLDLTAFQKSALQQFTPQAITERSPAPLDRDNFQPQIVQYIQYVFGDAVFGDKVGGDKVQGDKVGGNMYKDVNISGLSGSAVSLGGDATVGTQIKDVQGDVTVGNDNNNQTNQAIALASLLLLINQDLAALRAELRERDAKEATEDITAVEEELQAEKPDGAWIVRKLNNVAQIVGAASIATVAANQLGGHIQQAIQIAKSLFGG